jgi:hypothetical protein
MKNGRATTRSKPATLGLLANGSCGPWRIDVNETTSGPDRWFLQIEGPAVSFDFQIPSPGMIRRISEFLRLRRPSDGRPGGRGAEACELAIGTGKATPVWLRRDDEFDDRFFLVVGPADAPVVFYTLAGEDVKCVAAALEQAQEDLAAD